ncbi:sigma-54-dependent transcriptional regulator [Bacteroides clarus]|uniref:sigma-54-dependent transcriptional regulator n=1 Tax=Bacteroides clarus TaxID=626929 RepID=UPI0026670E08|nr:sigma-54 dependent transcriptional regulator [Bacteroides clarus]
MKKKILIVEDNTALAYMIQKWLSREGYDTEMAIGEPSARKLVSKGDIDLILSDVRLPEGDGISLLGWIQKEKMDVPFIVMTGYASVPGAVKAIKLGAKDYLAKPVQMEELIDLLREILQPSSSVRLEKKMLHKRISPKAVETERLAGKVAPFDIPVMICGANGTGKESIARIIHEGSYRRDKPFVAVNCGAVPKDLASSLFFGHRKGAFTGADSDRKGYFTMAKGGTLFLDEIGTVPAEIQTMLLRVLQENIYVPVGGNREMQANVRIVAATNEDMERAVRNGNFREDLFHRLAGFEIRQPSLSECPEDIIPLAEFFREKYSRELRQATTGFTPDARKLLLTYSWPGNVRELQNRIRRAVLLAEQPLIDIKDLNIEIQSGTPAVPFVIRPLRNSDDVERQSIIDVLKKCGGHRKKAAELLNVNPATLYRKMKKYGLR